MSFIKWASLWLPPNDVDDSAPDDHRRKNRIKGGTRKISDPPMICRHQEHYPPSHMVYEPGTWEHVCPGCGARHVFVVPSVFF